jgi:hypothetical protein
MGIPLDVEPKRPPEVDVREVRRPDPPQPVLLDADAVTVELRHDAVHAIRVPGQHDVGQQRVCARDGRHLLPATATLRSHLAAMNCALQLVHWPASTRWTL